MIFKEAIMPLHKLIPAGLILAFCSYTAAAQNSTAPIPARIDTMVVLGSAAPVPLAESPRSVVVLPLQDKKLAAETPLDLSLIHISEPTRQAEISYAVFCLK